MRVNTYLRLGVSPLFIFGSVVPLGDSVSWPCSFSTKGRYSCLSRVGECPSTDDSECRDVAVIGRYNCQEWGPELVCPSRSVLRVDRLDSRRA